ncbi:prospero homeobox protein 2 [Varanus komodoensis]|uniref:prospero homeobox protein 2 n=1 Tax=Varanus komodoensis TaxID=61221 RepID=UPI001CF78489|nr:prospero homeobox protein 2 [Varanus komodoensis]
MKANTVSDQYYGSASGHGEKGQPCVERNDFFPSASCYASIISHLLSQPEAKSELIPSFLFPSLQKAQQMFQSGGNATSSREASSMNQLHSLYSLSNSIHNEHLQAKRARVENIIRGMSIIPNPTGSDTPGESGEHHTEKIKEDFRENKRKQKLPQQQSLHETSLTRCCRNRIPPEEYLQLKKQLHVLQHQLKQLRESLPLSSGLSGSSQSQGNMEKMMDLMKEKIGQSLDNGNQAAISDQHKDLLQKRISKMRGPELSEKETGIMDSNTSASEDKPLSELLKHELIQVVTQAVDSVLKKVSSQSEGLQSQLPNGLEVTMSPIGREFVGAGENASSPWLLKGSPHKGSISLTTEKPPGFPSHLVPSKREPKRCQLLPVNHPIIVNSSEVQGSGLFNQMLLCGQNSPWGSSSPGTVSSSESSDMPWQPIKLRSSVMRQHRYPMSYKSIEMESLTSLPASNAEFAEMHPMMDGVYFPSTHIQEALNPSHLKKAKLMFFFSRYPTSSLLKAYFLDVQFTRCVTSQLIKWFSNFREFYYIQMEKFARQALLEGVTDTSNLIVTRDSELFRILNVHYNKGNDFEVPSGFLDVASLTLQEFFTAVRAGKDLDPSWKKSIYKIISKLDSEIPDIFKSTCCPKELIQG